MKYRIRAHIGSTSGIVYWRIDIKYWLWPLWFKVADYLGDKGTAIAAVEALRVGTIEVQS